MLNSLENSQFFNNHEIERLRSLGLWETSHTSPNKVAFGGLMLAPIMQIVAADGSTSGSEFAAIQEFIRSLQFRFGLATQSELESIGTDMGLLPMVKAKWNNDNFMAARALLADALAKLSDREAHQVRAGLAAAALKIAKAESGHFISLHVISKEEKPLLYQIIQDLHLETTAEGLNLLGNTESA